MVTKSLFLFDVLGKIRENLVNDSEDSIELVPVSSRKTHSEVSFLATTVVYDVGYDIRMIKTRKNMVTVRLLAATKEQQLRKT